MPIQDKPILLAKNIWLDAAVTAEYEDPIYQAYRLSDGSRLSKWHSSQAAGQNIDLVVPDADVVNVGAFVLDRGFVLPGATLVVKGAANAGFTQSVVTVATLATPDPAVPHLVTFDAVAKKYWRIEITNPSLAPAIFNAGVFPVIELLDDPVAPFDPQLRTIQRETFETDTGATQVTRRTRKREVRASYPRMSDTLYGKLLTAHTGSAGNPVWWWFRPVSAPTDGVYGYIMSDEDYPIVNALREGELNIVEA